MLSFGRDITESELSAAMSVLNVLEAIAADHAGVKKYAKELHDALQEVSEIQANVSELQRKTEADRVEAARLNEVTRTEKARLTEAIANHSARMETETAKLNARQATLEAQEVQFRQTSSSTSALLSEREEAVEKQEAEVAAGLAKNADDRKTIDADRAALDKRLAAMAAI